MGPCLTLFCLGPSQLQLHSYATECRGGRGEIKGMKKENVWKMKWNSLVNSLLLFRNMWRDFILGKKWTFSRINGDGDDVETSYIEYASVCRVPAYPPSRHRGGAYRLALVVWFETTTTAAASHYRRLAAKHYLRLCTVTSSGRYYYFRPLWATKSASSWQQLAVGDL